MATRTVRVGAISVTLHPHPPGVYERLFREVLRSRAVGKVHGDRFGMVTECYVDSATGTQALYGFFTTFVRIDPDAPWFNLETSEPASSEELGLIVLPDNLKPSMRQCAFHFDVASHTLFFETETQKGGVSHASMLRLLTQLFRHPAAVAATAGGTPRLQVLRHPAGLDELISWPRLKRLTISLQLPNPDFDDSDLRELERELRDQNASKKVVELASSKHEFLAPSDRTRTLSAIAMNHGFVEAKGEDGLGRAETRSSRQQEPLTEAVSYNADQESLMSAIRRGADSVLTYLRRSRRDPSQFEA